LDEFLEFLQQLDFGPVAVIEQEGNNGDKLIYIGLEKVLRSAKVPFYKLSNPLLIKRNETSKSFVARYRQTVGRLLPSFLSSRIKDLNYSFYYRITRPFEFRNNLCQCIILNGGASINDLWGGIPLLKNIIKNNPSGEIIVAPHTFYFVSTDFGKIFENSRQEIHLFCREKVSYCILNSLDLPPNVTIHLSNDLALYLNPKDIIPYCMQSKFTCSSYDLLAIRNDRTSIIPKEAVIKKLKGCKLLVQDISQSASFPDFVKIINNSKCVYTDRLHVAIAASILRKQTVLFSTSYFKNKAVFENSLKERFSSLRFCRDLESFDGKIC